MKKTDIELANEIENLIMLWHNSDKELTLQEYLGMTKHEYQRYMLLYEIPERFFED